MIEKVKIKEVKVVKIIRKKPHFKNKSRKPILYNLTVKDDNSFVLNHIITHNTGPQGANNFISFGGEPMPQFSLPFIVPKNKKVMTWVTHGTIPTSIEGWKTASKEGRVVYMKKSRGLPPHPFLRPSLYELKTVYLDKIVKNVCQEKFK